MTTTRNTGFVPGKTSYCLYTEAVTDDTAGQTSQQLLISELTDPDSPSGILPIKSFSRPISKQSPSRTWLTSSPAIKDAAQRPTLLANLPAGQPQSPDSTIYPYVSGIFSHVEQMYLAIIKAKIWTPVGEPIVVRLHPAEEQELRDHPKKVPHSLYGRLMEVRNSNPKFPALPTDNGGN